MPIQPARARRRGRWTIGNRAGEVASWPRWSLSWLFVALVIGGLVAVVAANHDGSTTASTAAPASAWSVDSEDRFEAACAGTGASADGCRCVRRELEQRFTEQQVDAMIAVLDRGDRLSVSVEGQLREAERACGAS